MEELKGIGPKKKEFLNNIGIFNTGDLLNYFPRGYEDRSTLYQLNQVKDGGHYLLRLKIISEGDLRFLGGRKSILGFLAIDETEQCKIVFFNQHYLKSKIHSGNVYYFYGRVSIKNNRIEIHSPLYEKSLGRELGGYMAKYPLTSGITQKDFRSMMGQALEIEEIENIIPEKIRMEERLLDRKHAYREIHFPENISYQQLAKKTLAFEELLIVQLALKYLQKVQKKEGFIYKGRERIEDILKTLKFPLTKAQERVLQEILEDMESPFAMNRLVQGDVGSGKTIIAILIMYLCVLNGRQVAFMAPTEILSLQHLESVRETLSPFGLQVDLLNSSLSKGEKEIVLSRLKKGEIDILIGTHALIQENVEFQDLGLVITDEQHRFGVKQRAILSNKGIAPDTLVMTATPIPRTLSLVFYGDLDISSIDELPPGRTPIKTYAVSLGMEERIMKFARENITDGGQVYIVCPLVEKNEELPLKSIEEMEIYLKNNYFKDFELDILHGKMKADEKNSIMEKFSENKIQVLIATTVIEVGINVPNASLMIIYNAERFGLSQLHQLRGRVGRGSRESHCILIYQGQSNISRERMKIMQETNDGFLVSEKDLELRGEGDLLGTNQSGLPQFKIADPFNDHYLVNRISEICTNILQNDLLELRDYYPLRIEIEKFLLNLQESIIFN